MRLFSRFSSLFPAAFLALSLHLPAADSPPPTPGPVPDTLRAALNLSPFYKKHIDVRGLPVLSSAKVADAALVEAARIVTRMLAGRDDILAAIVKNKIRLAVMSKDELTTDIPEHSDLTPKEYWDKRARGLGATAARPCISCAEENLLHLPGDVYANENILVHEFAHVVHEMGMNSLDPTFDKRLLALYDTGVKKQGLWKGTYAAENHKEYWAEGVQSYFDCNDNNNSQHNDADTRERLEKYDPALFALIDETFKCNPWRYEHPGQRRPARSRPVESTNIDAPPK